MDTRGARNRSAAELEVRRHTSSGTATQGAGRRCGDEEDVRAGSPSRAHGTDLGDAHAFGARPLGALALFETDGLAFTQFVEPRALARRIVEEILVPVVRQDKTEALVADEPLDCAVHRCCHTHPY